MIVKLWDFSGVTGRGLMEVYLICKKVLNHVKNPAYWINGAKHGDGTRRMVTAT